MDEKIISFSEEYPCAFVALCGLLGFAVSLPLAVVYWKFEGKTIGKEVAKQLMK